MEKITEDVFLVGVNDRETDLFEGQYTVPNGVAYNSYVIVDDKIAILDTVDIKFKEEWLKNLKSVLNRHIPDYLIVSHMEPDHSANIGTLLDEYPQIKVVGNTKTHVILKEYFPREYDEVTVKEGDTLSLGKHNLKFVSAPMVHWPEVMFTYDEYDKTLYSADAFGKFGALDCEEDWVDEARRYYIGIVGKYGVQVQNVLKKAFALEINKICPLHGPVLSGNLEEYVSLYKTWSSYTPEVDGVMIAFASVYGNTKLAAEQLCEGLKKRGVNAVMYDLARADFSLCVAEAFKYSHLVLATPTYNGELFPAMRTFIDGLVERNYQNRTIGLIENGSWAPFAADCMRKKFEKSKNITFLEHSVKIRGALNGESREQLNALVEELSK